MEVLCGLPAGVTTSSPGKGKAILTLSSADLMNGSWTIAKTTTMITYGA